MIDEPEPPITFFSAKERGFDNNKRGGDGYQPTPEGRKIVDAMAAFGIPQPQIAAVLDIGLSTLQKHFRDELDTAYVKANARVAQSLFDNATKNGNVAAQIFWLKTRARWKEPKQEHQHSGAVGSYDLTKVSEGELEQLIAILERVSEGAPAVSGPESGASEEEDTSGA